MEILGSKDTTREFVKGEAFMAGIYGQMREGGAGELGQG